MFLIVLTLVLSHWKILAENNSRTCYDLHTSDSGFVKKKKKFLLSLIYFLSFLFRPKIEIELEITMTDISRKINYNKIFTEYVDVYLTHIYTVLINLKKKKVVVHTLKKFPE